MSTFNPVALHLLVKALFASCGVLGQMVAIVLMTRSTLLELAAAFAITTMFFARLWLAACAFTAQFRQRNVLLFVFVVTWSRVTVFLKPIALAASDD